MRAGTRRLKVFSMLFVLKIYKDLPLLVNLKPLMVLESLLAAPPSIAAAAAQRWHTPTFLQSGELQVVIVDKYWSTRLPYISTHNKTSLMHWRSRMDEDGGCSQLAGSSWQHRSAAEVDSDMWARIGVPRNYTSRVWVHNWHDTWMNKVNGGNYSKRLKNKPWI